MRLHASPRRGGYSLVELMIGIVIMGSMTGSAILVTNSGLGSYQSAKAGELLQTKLHRSANRLLRELMSTGVSVLGPANLSDDFGSSAIFFQTPVDMDASGPVWGAPQSITLEYANGEIDDGIDNNNDGVADECVLILTRDAGLASAQRILLCSNVRETFIGEIAGNLGDDNDNQIKDEGGFNASLVGGQLTLRICVEAPSFGGATVIRQITTSIRLRN